MANILSALWAPLHVFPGVLVGLAIAFGGTHSPAFSLAALGMLILGWIAPTQANDIHPHEPFTRRDVPCVSCHRDRNFTLHERASYQSIPGHPCWMMAPIEMAWQGKSIGEISRQLKDPDRNGGRDLALLLIS